MPGEPDPCPPTDGCLPSGQADNRDGLREELFEAVLTEQRRDCIAGKRTTAGERLRQYPALACNRDQAAELIYHEFTLRQELGECPDWDEYLRQFPEHAVALQMCRQADQIVEHALAPEEPALCAPADLSGYELLEEIDRGGMGIVYRARQRSLDRIVALKMIRASQYLGEDERKRFLR